MVFWGGILVWCFGVVLWGGVLGWCFGVVSWDGVLGCSLLIHRGTLRIARYMLHVACSRLLVTCYTLHVTSWIQVTRYTCETRGFSVSFTISTI